MKENYSRKRAIAATLYNVTTQDGILTVCINCGRYKSVDPCTCVLFITVTKHRSVCVLNMHVCTFLIMFVVIKVTKVVAGEMREVNTTIIKGKMPQLLFRRVSEHFGKLRQKFRNQLRVCQQDMCHGVRE